VEQRDYTAIAKSLHWLIALLIFVQFPLGWIMGKFTGVQKFQAYNLHKSIGLTVLALMVLRLIWRLLHPAPTLPASMPKMERYAAHLGHAGLYLTVVLLTLSGWAVISLSKFPSVFFEFAPIPRLPWLAGLPDEIGKSYHDTYSVAHWALGLLLAALIAVHVAAALRHAIVLKDGILARMLPRFGRSKSVCAILIAAVVLCFADRTPAFAFDWSVKPEKSQIAFEASGGGSMTKGTFGQYRAEIEFDPDLPDQTAVRVVINMNSASTGIADADDALKSADFFNPAKFPVAEFVAKGAKPTGDGKYILNGRLTLKGVTKSIALPFSILIGEGTAEVKGETNINRLDFGIGPQTVAGLTLNNDVKLIVNLRAVRLDN
jgi:cytochrome b561/polyisoprenoid-binding protein YceI